MRRLVVRGALAFFVSCAAPQVADEPAFQRLSADQQETARLQADMQREVVELRIVLGQLRDQLATAQAAAEQANAAAAAAQATASAAAAKAGSETKPPVVTPPPVVVKRPVKKAVPRKKPGAIKGRIVAGGRPVPNALVYIVSVPGRTKAPKMTAQVRQRSLAFTPSTTVVVKGAEVSFPNEDKVFHNVFSLSDAARFDLGLYKSGTSKTVSFTQKGTVDVYCNIHPQMKAKIKVLDNAFYTYTDADGRYSIPGVPSGPRSVGVWREGVRESVTPVVLGPGGTAELNVTVSFAKTVDTHTRKDGTPYVGYK